MKVAETDKYAHVTYFFNAGKNDPYSNEDRHLVPTKKVHRLSDYPQMRAMDIGKKIANAVCGGEYEFIAANFANADIQGQTGNISAAIKGIETIDRALGLIWHAVHSVGGVLIITADHGNAETMKIDGKVCTTHTANPVPIIIAGVDGRMQEGGLRDIAPTVLSLLGIKKPREMTGRNLLVQRKRK